MPRSKPPKEPSNERELNDLFELRDATRRVGADIDLSSADAHKVMRAIMSGNVEDSAIVEFLSFMADKGPTITELQGFLDAMRAASVVVDVGYDVVDVVGTGGDGHHSVNISTMAAIALAATGVRVVKHGNRAATSLCGAADVLEALGLTISLDAQAIKACVDEVGIAFCFAPVFHPAMRHVAAARRTFARPTFFNLLGPLANPAHARSMLVGTSDAGRAALVAQVLQSDGVTAAVVCADDGMDEVSTLVPTTVWMGGESAVITPSALGISVPAPGALDGADASHNARVARDVLDGVDESRVNAVRDCVALNAAVARAVWAGARNAHELVTAVPQELPRVREVLENAEAGQLLRRWVEVSNQFGVGSQGA